MRTRRARTLMRFTIESVFGTELASISLLHALFYVHSGKDLQAIIGTTGGAQQDRYVGGSQRLPIRMAEALGEAVVLNAPYFGPKAGAPAAYFERDWSEEEWTHGCYGVHAPTGVLTQYGPALREPVGRIHWAGTETAERWAGYFDGAVESGHRAAAEVLAALG